MVRHLAGDGWECHVVLPAVGPLDQAFVHAGASVHVVPMLRISTSHSVTDWILYAVSWPVSLLRLVLLARKVDAQVVHSNSLHSWYGWAVAPLTRLPHVWHAREIVVQSGAALRVERLLTRQFADLVIAMSEAIASQFDSANVTVVRDDPDPAQFSPTRAGHFRADVGIPDDVALVGAACRIDTWKGIDVLLNAVPALRHRRPDAHIVVAGSAVRGKEEYARGLQTQAEGLPDVHWLGYRDDIELLMADVDVFVQASTEPEPYGLVLVEALSSGSPVVATAAGGPLEMLRGLPASNARLVPLGDESALASAMADLLPPTSSTAIRQNRPRLYQPAAPQWSELFAGVIARGRRRRAMRSVRLPGGKDVGQGRGQGD
jgi:glycosyltransferase involved in cell wall biosynthesis